jgi:pyrroloquinoline quinone (PQQ) biosynthesis protein C
MNIVPLDSSFTGLIDSAWLDALDATPFLSRCRSGKASRRELLSYVCQQHFYSRHFTRFLCALMARVAEDDRLVLTHNLFEEMGLGEFGSVPHSTLYRQMMGRLGVDASKERPNRATTHLVDLMFACASSDDPLIGLAALGLGAEAIVPHVYSQIVCGFQALGEPLETLEFFLIHIQGDDEHAVTMRKILERELVRDPKQLAVVRATAERVIAARAAFFEELFPAPAFVSLSQGDRHVQF